MGSAPLHTTDTNSIMAAPYVAPCSEPRTYVGCCHCQALKFTVELPKLDECEACSCSLCTMQGILWVFPKEADVHWERKGPMTSYRFASKKLDFLVSRLEKCSCLR